MNWQSVKLRVAKLERTIPRPPSPEEREQEEFDRRLGRCGDLNLIRIVESVFLWFELNPGATVNDLFGQPTAGLPGPPTELSQEDLAQFAAFVEGDAQYAEFLARNPQAKERSAAMMRFIGLEPLP